MSSGEWEGEDVDMGMMAVWKQEKKKFIWQSGTGRHNLDQRWNLRAL